nr:MAG TPA: HIRA B motif [Caudoviricetes sp.]
MDTYNEIQQKSLTTVGNCRIAPVLLGTGK